MNKNPFQALEEAAFDSFGGDNYDPESTYDPNNADGDHPGYEGDNFNTPGAPGTRVMGGQRRKSGLPAAQFDIQIDGTNATFGPSVVSLFDGQSGVHKITGLLTGVGITQLWQPVDAGQVFTDPVTGTVWVGHAHAYPPTGLGLTENIVYWDRAGNQRWRLAGAVPIQEVVISCTQIPYRALVDYATRGAFKIALTRMRFTTAAQIDNNFLYTSRNFLGGRKDNTITPNSYFKPDQFQSLRLDIPTPIKVDADKGLQYQVNSGEKVFMSIFVNDYVKSAV